MKETCFPLGMGAGPDWSLPHWNGALGHYPERLKLFPQLEHVSLLSRLLPEFCGNFISLIHLGRKVRWERRGEFWLCLQVFVAPRKSAHCNPPGASLDAAWWQVEGGVELKGHCTQEGRGCSPGEHRGRGDIGQAVVEAAWATGARKESHGLVRGMKFLFLSVTLVLVCTFPGLKTVPGSRWGPSSDAPPTFVAITNCSLGLSRLKHNGCWRD